MKKILNVKAILVAFLILLSFALTFAILYILYPESFFVTWKGRTLYLFFVWLIFLEIILNWKGLVQRSVPIKLWKIIASILLFSLPMIYVVANNFLGLNSAIVSLGGQLGIPFAPISQKEKMDFLGYSWPLSIEYLVFSTMFLALLLVTLNKEGLKSFSISILFISLIGMVYMVDTMYPYGYFTPLQAFVPLTAGYAAQILSSLLPIEYQVILSYYDNSYKAPFLAVFNGFRLEAQAYIAWPCAGVQSLLIYTFVLLIFFKKTTISTPQRIAYFLIGAVITYIINIFRIVNYFLIYIYEGSKAAQVFHDYYGELYSISWIVAYPIIIIVSLIFWQKIKIWRTKTNLLKRLRKNRPHVNEKAIE